MAKIVQSIAVGFHTQAAAGTYSTVLGLQDPTSGGNTWDSSTGLLMGAADVGIRGSGLEWAFARAFTESPVIADSYTRPLSSSGGARVGTFTFATAWAGNRDVLTGPGPIPAEHEPVMGLNALLIGQGMAGVAGAVGWQYQFTTGAIPISALVMVGGQRIEVRDCRVSGVVSQTAGETPILTATVQGTIESVAAAVLDSTQLLYGNQLLVPPPIVENTAHSWGLAAALRGFSVNELSMNVDIAETPDSNQPTGVIEEQTGRATQIAATIYQDDAGPTFDYNQIIADEVADLDVLQWHTGELATNTGERIEAIEVLASEPELRSSGQTVLGDKAATDCVIALTNVNANQEVLISFL